MSAFNYNNPVLNPYGITKERRPRIHRVHLDNVSSAEVNLATVYRSVTRVELISSYLAVSDTGPGNATPSYIVVKIDGMQQHGGNTGALNNAFCTLCKTGNASIDMSTSVDLYEYDRGAGGPDYLYTYEMPAGQLQNIGRLNISFYDPAGSAVTLANNNNLMVFEIMESTNFGQ